LRALSPRALRDELLMLGRSDAFFERRENISRP
jgi:hypothetical protein